MSTSYLERYTQFPRARRRRRRTQRISFATCACDPATASPTCSPVVDHGAKFTSEVFPAFVKSIGSSLIVGSAYLKNTNAKVEPATGNGVIGDPLRAYANGCKDDWDDHLTLAVFAINNAASTLGGNLTPFCIDRSAHPRLPLSPPSDDRATVEQLEHYPQRMRAIETAVRELLAAAQAERKAKLDAGRVDTLVKVGNRVLLRTKELLDAANIGKLPPRWDGPFTVAACPSRNAYTMMSTGSSPFSPGRRAAPARPRI